MSMEEGRASRTTLRLLAFAALPATVVVFVTWVGLYFVPQTGAWQWLIIPAGLHSIPGAMVAGILALIFSERGAHGIEEFEWLIAPANFLIYLYLFYLFARFLKRNRDRMRLQTGDAPNSAKAEN